MAKALTAVYFGCMSKRTIKQLTRGGRPPGRTTDKTLAIRIDAETLQRLERIAVKWQCSRAEVVRRLIKEAQV
jgi:hypothetical protein